jgi:hypothetical protein
MVSQTLRAMNNDFCESSFPVIFLADQTFFKIKQTLIEHQQKIKQIN